MHAKVQGIIFFSWAPGPSVGGFIPHKSAVVLAVI